MRLIFGGAFCGALAVACATVTSAQTSNNAPIYIDLDAGAAMYNTKLSGLTDQFDTGWSLDGRIGRHVNRVFRTELELGYESADTDQFGMKGRVANFDIMANGILDIPTQSPFTPYLGVGVGGARIEADITAPPIPHFDAAGWTFAYQGFVGADWHLTPRTSLDLRYRYLDAQPVHLAGFKTDHNSGVASAGLKLTF